MPEKSFEDFDFKTKTLKFFLHAFNSFRLNSATFETILDFLQELKEYIFLQRIYLLNSK